MRTARALAALVLSLSLIGPARAQEATPDLGPRLTMSLDEDAAIPGQPVVLRVQILVPTYLPKPPVFPSFEVPGVMVRLPERASGPTSETIDGETWAGVLRSYRLIPMTPGTFTIPAQPLTVTYADPDTNEPITVELMTNPVTFEGLMPEGAEGLDPFIAAENLVIDQQVDGDPADMAPGGSVQRVVSASITGSSPLFIPPLVAPLDSEAIASYPAEPALEESENRGVVSGKRTERVTYVAEAGGRAVAPALELRWFNIKSSRIETATAPEIAFAVSGAVVTREETGFDWRAVVPWVVGGLVLLALLAWLVRLLLPRLTAWRHRRREAWLGSETYAYRQAEAAVRRRDFSAAAGAVSRWVSRLPGGVPNDDGRLAAAMARLGATIYGHSATGGGAGASTADWNAVRAALGAARKGQDQGPGVHGHVLPPLNPVS